MSLWARLGLHILACNNHMHIPFMILLLTSTRFSTTARQLCTALASSSASSLAGAIEEPLDLS